ncbi:unnamed protein product [Orchesella dallaii]|uniref:DDE Tnp4 domain-containing protein n=1 Tax=Orchesella dallaii TaxID=48710 RepID=A0ABP1PW92_9HEXA
MTACTKSHGLQTASEKIGGFSCSHDQIVPGSDPKSSPCILNGIPRSTEKKFSATMGATYEIPISKHDMPKFQKQIQGKYIHGSASSGKPGIHPENLEFIWNINIFKMPHTCCVRDGKRIFSTAKKIRLTSQRLIWEAIQHFGENVPFGEPICEGCRDELRRKYTKVKGASNSARSLPDNLHRNQEPNGRNMENVSSEDPTATGANMAEVESVRNSSPSLNEPVGQSLNDEHDPQPSTSTATFQKTNQKKRPTADSEEYIPPEAQYSQSNGSVLLVNDEFEFGSEPKQREIKYFVEGIFSVPGTERKCFICPVNSRNKIPIGAIDQLVISNRIFVPFNNRCCNHHIKDGLFTDESVKRIVEISRKGAFLTPKELGDLFNRIADKADRQRIDFDSSVISDDEYKILTGISKENFKILHDEYIIESKTLKNSKNRSTRNALAIFLAKLRLGVSQEFLGFLFGMDKRRISDAITSITNALEEHFVPKFLGYKHIRREDVKNHTPELVTEMYNVDPDNIVLILDGTYIYIQKSQDHQTQIETYSLHKHRNLVKAMMVVLPDGYILEAESMYKSNSKNNDASMLRDMFEIPDGIKVFVKKDDHFILDRGFRDILTYLADLGIIAHMPHFLDLKIKLELLASRRGLFLQDWAYCKHSSIVYSMAVHKYAL